MNNKNDGASTWLDDACGTFPQQPPEATDIPTPFALHGSQQRLLKPGQQPMPFVPDPMKITELLTQFEGARAKANVKAKAKAKTSASPSGSTPTPGKKSVHGKTKSLAGHAASNPKQLSADQVPQLQAQAAAWMHQANLWQQYQAWSVSEDGNCWHWQNAWPEGFSEYSVDGDWLPAAAWPEGEGWDANTIQDSGLYNTCDHWTSSTPWLEADAWDADAFEDVVPCAAALAAAGTLESLNSAPTDEALLAPKSMSPTAPGEAKSKSVTPTLPGPVKRRQVHGDPGKSHWESINSVELLKEAAAQKHLALQLERQTVRDHELLDANPQDGSKNVAFVRPDREQSLGLEERASGEEPREEEDSDHHVRINRKESVDSGRSSNHKDRASKEEPLMQEDKLEDARLPQAFPAKKTWAQLVKGGQPTRSRETASSSHARSIVQNPVPPRSGSLSASGKQTGQHSARANSGSLPGKQPEEIGSSDTLLTEVAQEPTQPSAGSLPRLDTEQPSRSNSLTLLSEQLADQTEQLPEPSSGSLPALDPPLRDSDVSLKPEAALQQTLQQKELLHSSKKDSKPSKTSHGSLPECEVVQEENVQPNSSCCSPVLKPAPSKSGQVPAIQPSSSSKASKSSYPSSRQKPAHVILQNTSLSSEQQEQHPSQPDDEEDDEEEEDAQPELFRPQSEEQQLSRVSRRPASKVSKEPAARTSGKQSQRQRLPAPDSSSKTKQRGTASGQKKTTVLQQAQAAGLAVLQYPKCAFFLFLSLAVFVGQWSMEDSSEQLHPSQRAAIQGKECLHCMR